MSPLFKCDDEVAKWVGERVGTRLHHPYTAIGAIDENDDKAKLVCGFVFHEYNGANVEMTGACDVRPSRQILTIVSRYVFEQLGCRRMTFRTKKSNTATMRFLSRRADLEAWLEGWFPDDDAVQYRLLKENCQFLPKATT